MDQVEGLEGRSLLGGGRDGGRAEEGTPNAGRREAAPHPGEKYTVFKQLKHSPALLPSTEMPH